MKGMKEQIAWLWKLLPKGKSRSKSALPAVTQTKKTRYPHYYLSGNGVDIWTLDIIYSPGRIELVEEFIAKRTSRRGGESSTDRDRRQRNRYDEMKIKGEKKIKKLQQTKLLD